jgi:hypothetical protein
MFAGAQRGHRHLAVKTIWHRDVHDVHIGTPQQLAVIAERLWNAVPGRQRPDHAGQIAEGRDPDPQTPQRLNVNRADKAGADDAGPELIDWVGWIHGLIAWACGVEDSRAGSGRWT